MRSLTPATITLIMLIVVGALIAAYIAKTLFAVEEQPPAVSSRLVPMALSDIPAGTLITEEFIGNGNIQSDKLERDMLISSAGIVNRVAKVDIKAAQPIRANQLYQPGERAPLKMEAGKRAVSIGIGDGSAIVDGFIKPGDYVDVHFTVDSNNNDERYRGGLTLTMFKGVKVLGINGQQRPTMRTSRGANTVTLELTPEQANIIFLAINRGTLRLAYTDAGPGTGVVDVEDEHRAYFEEVLGLAPIPEPPKPFFTEIYRGSGRNVIEFRDGQISNNNNYQRIQTSNSDQDDNTNRRSVEPAPGAGRTNEPGAQSPTIQSETANGTSV